MSQSRKPALLLLVLISLLGIGVFLSLGNWQLNQAERKRELLADYAERQKGEPLDVGSHKQLSSLPIYTPVMLTGKWLIGDTILLDNRRLKEQTGVLVLTPFELDSGEAVLINRGFIPLTSTRELADQEFANIKDLPVDAQIKGFYWTWPRVGLDMTPIMSKLRGFDLWSNLVPDSVVASKPHILLPRSGVIMLGESMGGFPRDFQPINQGFGPEKHIAYAIQWFCFAGIIVLLWIAYFWRRRS